MMRKCLKMRLTGSSPETFIACEYSSDRYLSWVQVREMSLITWQSEPFAPDALARLLESKGWHQTDICDALDEARTFRQEV
jgi:hypothetical protein